METDKSSTAMRETDRAIFAMLEVLFEMMVRRGMTSEELKTHFARAAEGLKGYPEAKKQFNGLREKVREAIRARERESAPPTKPGRDMDL